jgi:hypothetical protein
LAPNTITVCAIEAPLVCKGTMVGAVVIHVKMDGVMQAI